MKHFTTSVPIDAGRVRLPMQIEGVRREALISSLAGDEILCVSVPENNSLEQSWFASAALKSDRRIDISGSSSDVGNWEEYGTINLELLRSPLEIEMRTIDVALEAFFIQSAFVLVVDESDHQIEAGIVISAEDGREIFVVAGDIPGAFSLRMPDGQGDLRPQFPWQDYRRILIDAA
jgi:hypothetical protein